MLKEIRLFFKNKCNLYLAFFLLYYVLTNFFRPFFLTTIVMYGLMSVSFYHFIYANLNFKLSRFFKALTILVFIFLFYGLLLALSDVRLFVREGEWRPVDNFLYIKQITTRLLPFYSFYVYAKKGVLTEQNIKIWTAIFCLYVIALFVNHAHYLSEIDVLGNGSTNNFAYSFVSLIPIGLFVSQKKYTKLLFLWGCLIFILLSGKRGAIVCGLCSLVIFFFFQIKEFSFKKVFGILFGVAISVLLLSYTYNWVIDSNLYFQSRIGKLRTGDIGHRSELYTTFINHFLNDDVFHQLFGNGANATLIISNNYAHNDWLEILINQGVLGVIIYLFYFSSFFKELKRK